MGIHQNLEAGNIDMFRPMAKWHSLAEIFQGNQNISYIFVDDICDEFKCIFCVYQKC